MKCKICDARIAEKTAKKNLGKCGKCIKIDTKIVSEMKRAR